MGLLQATIDGIKAGEHKMFVVPSALELSESIRDEMAAEGYQFAYAGSDGNGSREYYFVPLPRSGMTP
jgi:hypothetical protein